MNRREMLAATGALTAGVAGAAFAHPARNKHTHDGEDAPAGQAVDQARPANALPPNAIPGWNPDTQKYTLPPLPYAYNALEPAIDEQTMRLHHDIHHQGYVNGLNKALATLADARKSGDLSAVPSVTHDLAFHGAGHILHTLFWNIMAPQGNGGGGTPQGKLAQLIDKSFGSFDAFKAHFIEAATSVKGSGWGILAHETLSNNLIVLHAHNHESLTTWSARPILCLDVWEHAYYLKYQNKRGAYVSAFFDVINWTAVGHMLPTHMTV